MDTILQPLHDLDGVHATIVSDASGQILGFHAHAVYDRDLLQKVSRLFVNALDSVKLVQEDWEAINIQFAEGRLLLRNLAAGSRGKEPVRTLCVIADARLNPSFATVAIRVAVNKLKALFEANPQAAMSGSGAAPRVVAQPTAVSTPALSASGQARAPEVATSGLSWSGISNGSSASVSGVSVADSASSNVLTLCTHALAKSVGPMAKLLVKEAVQRLCVDRPFSKEQTPLLLSELEKSIDNPSAAARFRAQVLKAV